MAKEWFQIASTQGYEPSQVKIQQISLLEQNTLLQKQKDASNEDTSKSQPEWPLSHRGCPNLVACNTSNHLSRYTAIKDVCAARVDEHTW